MWAGIAEQCFVSAPKRDCYTLARAKSRRQSRSSTTPHVDWVFAASENVRPFRIEMVILSRKAVLLSLFRAGLTLVGG
jgi:hypothetical protein